MHIPPMLGYWFVISMCWAATSALSQEHHKDHSAADLNRQFQDPNLDVQRFVQRFETDSREIFAQWEAIVQAVDLRPGLAVADIGAGTGLFTWMFAEKSDRRARSTPWRSRRHSSSPSGSRLASVVWKGW